MPAAFTEVRDRALSWGTRPLSDEDLLKLLGVTTQYVTSASALRSFAQMDPSEVVALLGLQAGLRVIAAVELGRRALLARETPLVLTTPEQVVEYLTPSMLALPKEQFRVLALNSNGLLLRDAVVAEGAPDACPVDVREVFTPVLASRATAVVFAHNHPSGVAEPSSADLAATHQLQRTAQMLGVDVLDHLIIGNTGEYHSMFAHGELLP